LPLFYASHGLAVGEVGFLAAAYPAVWGLGQIGIGALSDRIGRKGLIVGGMLLQGAAIGLIAAASHVSESGCSQPALLGFGTAMVYPTLLAAVADVATPSWRGAAVGVYRLWRDLGFAVGAIVAGALADRAGMPFAIGCHRGAYCGLGRSRPRPHARDASGMNVPGASEPGCAGIVGVARAAGRNAHLLRPVQLRPELVEPTSRSGSCLRSNSGIMDGAVSRPQPHHRPRMVPRGW
jgi:MFS family permease